MGLAHLLAVLIAGFVATETGAKFGHLLPDIPSGEIGDRRSHQGLVSFALRAVAGGASFLKSGKRRWRSLPGLMVFAEVVERESKSEYSKDGAGSKGLKGGKPAGWMGAVDTRDT